MTRTADEHNLDRLRDGPAPAWKRPRSKMAGSFKAMIVAIHRRIKEDLTVKRDTAVDSLLAGCGAALLLILLAACGGPNAEKPSVEIVALTPPSTAEPNSQSLLPSPTYPTAADPTVAPTRTTTTGILEVDRAVTIVLSNDLAARRELVQMTTAGCTKAQGLGGPPKCRADQPEGTPVEYLPLLGPGEGVTLSPEAVDETLAFAVSRLYAIYRLSEAAFDDPFYPAGEYGLVFEAVQDESTPTTVTLQLNGEGKIVRLDFPAGSPDSAMVPEASEVLVAPPTGPPDNGAEARDRPTPTPELDLSAIEIRRFEVLTEVPRPGPGDPVKVIWETDGDRVHLCISHSGNVGIECLDLRPAGTHTFTLREEDPIADHWADITLDVRKGMFGEMRSARIPVECHYDWFADGLSDWCPHGPIHESQAEAQTFQRGLLIRQGASATVIFDETGDLCQAFNFLPEPTGNPPPLSPPVGFYSPAPSLADLWSGNLPGTGDLRERLGWAVAPAQMYTLMTQCERTPEGLGDCFALAPDGRVFNPIPVTGPPGPEGVTVVEGTCH